MLWAPDLIVVSIITIFRMTYYIHLRHKLHHLYNYELQIAAITQ